jgi:DNA-binding helix-hairpin-helix protein with protein kinase domain
VTRSTPGTAPVVVRDSAGRSVRIGGLLGEGGEGQVRSVVGVRGSVAKLYHPALRSEGRREKVAAMLAAPPRDPMAARGRVSLAWPRSLLTAGDGTFAGFTMPGVDPDGTYELHRLWKAKQRPAGCTWSHLVRVAANLASVFEALHQSGYVVGDVNESNFLVRDTALVVAVDLDSIQVPNPAGGVFLCEVHKPEFAPPELQRGFDFGADARTPQHDRFGLAVLIWQLLMLGRHPFAAGHPVIATNIQQNLCWAVDGTLDAPAGAPPVAILPEPIRALAQAAFTTTDRPPAARWHAALSGLASNLVTCKANPKHRHSKHSKSCPWCAYRERWKFDPFDPDSTKAAYERSRERNKQVAEQWSRARSATLARELSRANQADLVATMPGAPIPSAPAPSPVSRLGPRAHMPPRSLPGQHVDPYQPSRIPKWWWAALLVAAMVVVAGLLFLPIE